MDWWGNVTFALGLFLIMVSVTYGIRPYGGHATGWSSPRVLALLGAGVACLVAFALIERGAAEPMFRLPLFRIRAFTFGTLSTFLSAVARGGLLFMLIIWLQGIWLPLHGVDFADTPLRAGIYMLPLTLGMLVAGPTSGYLSDRFGARWFATGGMLGSALSFFLLLLLPIDFSFPLFALVLAAIGVSMGLFAARFGEANMPIDTPTIASTSANSQNEKSIGSSVSRKKLSAEPSIPPVANQRAPKRSDRYPDVGPAISMPIVSGSM